MVYYPHSIKNWLNWPLIRAHLCTLAASVSFNASLGTPRAGARFGGVQFALALTAALLLLALPLTLLQLAVGQLSQQDAVGVWRAVPVFKGVGYLRLLVSFMGSIYTAIYLALSVAYFLYTLSSSIPFSECTVFVDIEDSYVNIFNASDCLDATFMAPPNEKPEYFTAMATIIIFLWIALPFLLYSPVKIMKRVFYVLGPLIVILGVAVVSGMAGEGRLAWFAQARHWRNFLYPDIWFRAVTQALLSSEIAGGYLISAGDAIYSSNNVQWATLILIGSNIVASWTALLFWFGACGGGADAMDAGPAAVLVQLYRAAQGGGRVLWPLLAFAALALSGVVTMLIRLFPLFERIRRVGGSRWRLACAGGALACAGASLAALAGRWTALHVLEDVAVPLIACVATILEISAFVFIYGWKVLMEDIEFLTGGKLRGVWAVGWCAAPGVLAPLVAWWAVAAVTVSADQWAQPPWTAPALTATAALILLVFIVFAIITICRQVHYDIIGKLKSAFKPSRQWGPRDPITHYYWLAGRDEAGRGEAAAAGTRYRRRELGHQTGISSIALPTDVCDVTTKEQKKRVNSDDWIYTVYRKKYIQATYPDFSMAFKKYRSKSLEIKIEQLQYSHVQETR